MNIKFLINSKKLLFIGIILISLASACTPSPKTSTSDAASRVYVAPGEHDELYAFLSGGFSGQMTVYGLPSGRLLKLIPTFSQDPETGYGYTEETKAMFQTSYGFVPWDDTHHPKLSLTDGVADGRWLFVNGNNTPRIARIDLTTFTTVEILELPNTSGNHCAPFPTENTEYIINGTRFSVPIPQRDVSLDELGEKMKGSLSFVKVDQETGNMSIAFQLLVPGYDYDLAHGGKGPSKDWVFFTTYNTEQAVTLKEINSSQYDKDFIAAVNWRKAEQYWKEGKGRQMPANYFSNRMNSGTHTATSENIKEVTVLLAEECEGCIYYIPTPKSPHGVDVDPTGEYIVGGGKLAAIIPVHSFSRMLKAIENEEFEEIIDGIPVLKYESVIAGEVQDPGIGALHTEFDGKGYAYTSMYITSEITKWKLGTWEVIEKVPSYYSIGHLLIPGGDTRKPYGKYVISMNKSAKDRFLPTGPKLAKSAQMYDITGDKMELLLDFPTIGEPHYAQAIEASIIKGNSKRIYRLDENMHPHAVKTEAETRVERDGNIVRVYMSAIRSHFAPDNIEGIHVGDTVYFHVTSLEQDWDIGHGLAIMGSNNSELMVLPGETATIKWVPQIPGIFPFYCTDFCSALHQEMQGFVRVSEKGAGTPIRWRLGKNGNDSGWKTSSR